VDKIKHITIELIRNNKDKGRYTQKYQVPFKPTMRVLDAVKYIKDHIDGSIAYRWNCGMGICGSCAMEVNGVPVLACKTELKKPVVLNKTRIGPLASFPVIKDLVADYSGVYSVEKRLELFFKGKVEGKFLKFYDEEIKDLRKFRGCIECMICVTNCKPKREGKQIFLGPKSIVKAMSIGLHPKDDFDRSPLLEKEGLWNCAETRCCQRNCPEDIPITDKGIIPAKAMARK